MELDDGPAPHAASTDLPASSIPSNASESPPADRGQERACLQYEPKRVVLRGVIERVTFPGPPYYESVAQGDDPETYWLLRLDQASCVDADPDDEFDVAYSNVRRVQLVLNGKRDYAKYRHLVGKHVEALGELFGSNTGHHYTEVLLTVSELRRARSQAK